uniref:EGF-like domain-containing protein n=1 Tax=Paramormyrops kingsleyae TaxID=1676925 RepID=A0A3B3Q9G7_9TELE
MLLKITLFFTFLLLVVQASTIKDLNDHDAPLPRDSRKHTEELPEMTKQFNVKRMFDLGRRRTKRSIIYQTGVKVCPQESIKDALASHQAYYKLRVCQTAVWEAFRIFLDRVPSTSEYDSWVSTCQQESLCMSDLLQSFSSSREHVEMLHKTVNVQDKIDRERSKQHDPERASEKVQEIPSANPCEFLLPSQASEEKVMVHKEAEAELSRPSPEEPEDQVLEFSITIADPSLSELANETHGDRYEELTLNLRNQMLHVLEKLSGFKEIRVLGFRSGDVSVRYAAVFDGDALVSETAGSESTVPGSGLGDQMTIKTHLKDMVTKALREDTSLPLDIHSVCFAPEQVTVRSTLEETPTPEFHSEMKMTTETTATAIEEPHLSPASVEVGKHQEENDLENLLESDVFMKEDIDQSVETTSGPVIRNKGSARTESVPITRGYDLSTGVGDRGRDVVNHPVLSFMDGVLGLYENVSGTVLVTMTQPLDEPITEAQPGEGTDKAEQGQDLRSKHPEIPDSHATTDSVVSAVLTTACGQEDMDDTRQKEKEQRSETSIPIPIDYDGGDPAGTDYPREHASPSSKTMTAESHSREMAVVFSLRVANLMFANNLLNKSSPDYRLLENVFLQVMQISSSHDGPNSGSSDKSEPGKQRIALSIPLLPYLHSSVTGFKELEILSFRNGSVIFNREMKTSGPYNVTEAVHRVIANFCCGVPKRLDVEVEHTSPGVESAEVTDPCRFLACGEFSRCAVNALTREAECVCEPGYGAPDGPPCRSLCSLQPDYCLNGGQCHIVPGGGATCRCPVGRYWHFHGERCTELVSLPVDPFLIISCLVGFLALVLAVIGILLLINRKCIQTRRTVSFVHKNGPFAFARTVKLNPLFESDDGTLIRVSSLTRTPSTGPGFTGLSEQDTLSSVDDTQFTIEISRPLHATRPDKLDSEMDDFRQCFPFEGTTDV